MVQDRAILTMADQYSHMVYRTVPFSITLNDLKCKFQGHTIISRWISPKRCEIHT